MRRLICPACGLVYYSAAIMDKPCSCGGRVMDADGVDNVRRRGISYRQALPAVRWPAMVRFLAAITARNACGRMKVGRFLREYRQEVLASQGKSFRRFGQ